MNLRQNRTSDPPLRVSASEFACVYKRTRQTVHKWAKNGWFKEGGFPVERDAKGHLFILIPPICPNGQLNEDYQKFLVRKTLWLYPKLEARLKKLEQRRPFDSKYERQAWLFVSALLGTIIWQVTGKTAVESTVCEPTQPQWDEIDRRMRRIAEIIENKHLKFARKRQPSI